MMSKKKRAEQAARTAEEAEQTSAALGREGDGDRSTVEAGEEEGLTAVERLERERDEYLQKWQRAQADYQNLRRRMVGDLDDARRRAKESVFAELLVVLDYLDMAASTSCESEDAKNLLVGVEMTRMQFLQLLTHEGITPIDAGGMFNPSEHDAIENVPTDDHEPGTLLETVRKGYRMGEHVLRFAQVKVAASVQDAGTEEKG